MFKNLLTLIICLLGTAAWGQLVNDGATITIQNGATLVVEGDVTNLNAGTINNDGTLKIAGDLTSTAGTLGHVTTPGNIEFQGDGTNTVTLGASLVVNDLIINKVSGDVDIQNAVTNNITINGDITWMTDGLIDINAIDLIYAGTVPIPMSTASASRFVQTDGDGELQITNVGVTAKTFPVGFAPSQYNPIDIASNSGTPTVGVTMFANVHETGNNDASTQISTTSDVINATWLVNGGTDLNVTAHWDSGDQPGTFDAAKSGLSQWDDSEMKWDLTIEDGLGVGATSANRSNVTPGAFAVGSKSVMDYIIGTPKVILSGAYNGTDMNDNLRQLGFLPTTEPYTLLGYTHEGLGGGESVDMASDFDQPGTNNDIVDWIFLELRDENDNTLVKGTMSALLQRDGDIVGVDMQPIKFSGFKSNENYHIAVKHRNHLGFMTLASMTFNQTTSPNLNFMGGATTFGTNALYNSGSNYQMWGGNFDNNIFVEYAGGLSDITPISTKVFLDPGNTTFSPTYIVPGYNLEDGNLDGNVIYAGGLSDITPITTSVFLNPSNTTFSPTFRLNEQLPEN